MKVLGFDTETYLFQPGLPAPRFVCASWADETREQVTLWKDTRDLFVRVLERGDHLAGINIAYDIGVMVAMDPTLLPLVFRAGNQGQFHCCSIREALNDIALGQLVERGDEEHWNRYSMSLLMDRHFGVDISDDKVGDVWRYKYAQLDGVPLHQWPEAAVSYPKRDARRSLDLFHIQEGIPVGLFGGDSKHRNLHDEPAQVRAAIAIQLMRMWGFRTDGAYIEALEQKVDAIWNEARAEFAKAGIYRPDGTKDMKHLASLVTAAYHGDPPRTPTGGVSCDRDTLEESGDPLLMKLGTSGKNDKRKTVYIPALRRGVHVPVTPEFNILVSTGRVSSDWQQMPQKGDIREGVTARPGTVLSSNDLGGAELRTMSQRALNDPDVRFSKMAEFLNAGKDTHSHVAAQFLGLTYEAFLARKVELDAYRKVGKIWNFGKGGGAGAFAMAYNAKVKENIRLCRTLKRATACGGRLVEGFVGRNKKRVCALCVQIAKELGEKWLQAWPEQKLLFDKASRLTRHGAKVASVTFGSERVRGECGYTQWLNNPFQSAVGDGVKAAMWQMAEESYTDRHSPLWGSRQVLNIHDELWTEHPDDTRSHDAAFRVAEILCQAMDRITPDVKNEVEPALMRRPFKAAKAVYDRAGKLKPWWPADWAWAPDFEAMARDKVA